MPREDFNISKFFSHSYGIGSRDNNPEFEINAVYFHNTMGDKSKVSATFYQPENAISEIDIIYAGAIAKTTIVGTTKFNLELPLNANFEPRVYAGGKITAIKVETTNPLIIVVGVGAIAVTIIGLTKLFRLW